MLTQKLLFIEKISRDTNNTELFNIYNSCRYRLVALQIIRNRYESGVKNLLESAETLWKDEDIPLSLNQVKDYSHVSSHFFLLDQTRLDHESFIIYSRIFMDNIARVAKLIINDNLPNSFSDQIKWYTKKEFKNNLQLNSNYRKLLNENSNWFNLNLKSSRDKFIIHADSKMILTKISPKDRTITFSSVKGLSGSKEGYTLLKELKTRYENTLPNLKPISNFWELYTFFYYNENYLNSNDICKLMDIGQKNGVYLSNIGHLTNRIHNFIDQFHGLFNSN